MFAVRNEQREQHGADDAVHDEVDVADLTAGSTSTKSFSGLSDRLVRRIREQIVDGLGQLARCAPDHRTPTVNLEDGVPAIAARLVDVVVVRDQPHRRVRLIAIVDAHDVEHPLGRAIRLAHVERADRHAVANLPPSAGPPVSAQRLRHCVCRAAAASCSARRHHLSRVDAEQRLDIRASHQHDIARPLIRADEHRNAGDFRDAGHRGDARDMRHRQRCRHADAAEDEQMIFSGALYESIDADVDALEHPEQKESGDDG